MLILINFVFYVFNCFYLLLYDFNSVGDMRKEEIYWVSFIFFGIEGIKLIVFRMYKYFYEMLG